MIVCDSVSLLVISFLMSSFIFILYFWGSLVLSYMKPRKSKEHAFPMWNPLHKYFKGDSPFLGYVLAGNKYLQSQDEFEYTGR